MIRLPEAMEETAKLVVVACEVVALSAVKFCKVDEPVASRFAMVASPFAVSVLKVAPLVALSCAPMVVEPVMASVVPVALLKSNAAKCEVDDAKIPDSAQMGEVVAAVVVPNEVRKVNGA